MYICVYNVYTVDVFIWYVHHSVFVLFRHYFDNAHDAYLMHGDTSDLYVVIIDEIDAICKPRGKTYMYNNYIGIIIIYV